MDPKLIVVNPIDFHQWDDLLLSLEGHSFFYSSAWASALFESYEYKPAYFTLIDGGRLVTLVPFMDVQSMLTGRRGVSLPFTDYCEPVVNGGMRFQDVFSVITDYGKGLGWKTIEFRGGASLFNDTTPYVSYFNHTLTILSDEKQVFSRFKNSTQRNIRKATAEGVQVKVLNSLESINQFFRLNCMTRKYHGLPPQPYRFFRNVYDHIISKNMGSVVMAYYRDRPIAGAVYFYFGEKAVYKYGASHRGYQHLRANNLVMWEAIRSLCRGGYKSLCFGRTEHDNHGLRRFKLDWGTRESVVNYYKYDLRQNLFLASNEKVMRWANRVFRMMPVSLLNILGRALYRHMG